MSEGPALPSSTRPEGEESPRPLKSFVGRERQLELLLDGLDEALAGRGGLFLLGGEPGIGKTRLAEEFAARAAGRGARVLLGRSWEAGGAPAYWPWIQSLRELLIDLGAEELKTALGRGGGQVAQIFPELRERVPDLPEPASASPDSARFELFNAISNLLRRASEEQPLSLVLEDLHAADAPSVLLLRFVGDSLSAQRVMIIATYRTVDLTREDPLGAALQELARVQRSARVPLTGLRREDVGRLIGVISGRDPSAALVADVYDRTEGNPLFVQEFVRLLHAEGGVSDDALRGHLGLPEGVRDVIGHRLDRLSPEARELLRPAAVAGKEFAVGMLERISGRPAHAVVDTLHDAIAARVLEGFADDPGRLRFTHSLIRDTVYEELMPADRHRIHASVGQALEEAYAGNPEPYAAELAHHFFEAGSAGDPGKAARYATVAGNRAVSALAYEEAVRLFRMAVAASRDSPDERRRCELLVLLGDALGRSGDTAMAKETFLSAAEIATRLDQPELLSRAAIGYAGRFHWVRAGTDRHVVPLLRQALGAIGSEDSTLRVLLLGRLAGALRDQPGMESRGELAREAVEMARRIGDSETLAYALLAQAYAGSALGPDGSAEQRALADELEEIVEEIGDRERLVDVRVFRFLGSMRQGNTLEAREEHERTASLAEELHQPSQHWMTGLLAQVLALQDGRFDEAERLIEATLEVGHASQGAEAEASRLFALFVLRRERGQLDELEEELQRAPARHPGYRGMRCMQLALLCDGGRLEEARAFLERLAADAFAAFPKDLEWLSAMTLVSEAAVTLNDRDRAETLYESLRPYEGLVGLLGGEVSTGPVSRVLGSLASVLDRWDEAARHFDAATAQARSMGARPWAAHAQHDHAAMLARRGDSEDRARAIELAIAARDLAEEMGMVALRRRVEELLARLGEGEGVAPTGSPLTPREREVAGLVAEGLTNRQIAQRLFVSERTAESHVQHILTKLGFTSRAQVAAWAVREGLAGTT